MPALETYTATLNCPLRGKIEVKLANYGTRGWEVSPYCGREIIYLGSTLVRHAHKNWRPYHINSYVWVDTGEKFLATATLMQQNERAWRRHEKERSKEERQAA